MKKLLTATLATFLLAFGLHAQEATTEPAPDGWDIGLGFGADLAQLLMLNPKVGSGQNRIDLAGNLSLFANKKQGRMAWGNLASWQFGVQKLGSGVLPGSTEKIPFQKSIDVLRFNSKVGYSTSENSKWFYAADFDFLSQITSTYSASDYKGAYLKEIPSTSVFSKLFSPATITLSLGMDYKPQPNLSIYFSPVAFKSIIVADDAIASLEAKDADGNGKGVSVHGNEWTSATDYKNAFNQLGALLRLGYNTKFLEDRITFKSNLGLYSNYLKNPQNIDVDWTNEFNFNIYKGLQLALLLNAFYDHDVLVQITDYNAPNAVAGLGRRLNITEQMLLKYTVNF